VNLSALDPGKQGLKLIPACAVGAPHRLSALDPGKQGLKPVSVFDVDDLPAVFQRLIQENKD